MAGLLFGGAFICVLAEQNGNVCVCVSGGHTLQCIRGREFSKKHQALKSTTQLCLHKGLQKCGPVLGGGGRFEEEDVGGQGQDEVITDTDPSSP